MAKKSKRQRVYLTCCVEAIKNETVFLCMDECELYNESEQPVTLSPPTWHCRGYDEDHQTVKIVSVEYCPHCGQPVPDIEPADTTGMKIMTVTDGGYYCSTCNKRLECCRCCYPEQAWRIKK